jgi:hypothetical protein
MLNERSKKMKKAILAALVTRVGGTEFQDGQRVVKVSLEDGFSFNLNESSPLIKKICEGREVDITYTGKRENKTQQASGAEYTFTNLSGVRVLDIRRGQEQTFDGIDDVDQTIVFKKVQSGAAATPTGEVGKV